MVQVGPAADSRWNGIWNGEKGIIFVQDLRFLMADFEQVGFLFCLIGFLFLFLLSVLNKFSFWFFLFSTSWLVWFVLNFDLPFLLPCADAISRQY